MKILIWAVAVFALVVWLLYRAAKAIDDAERGRTHDDGGMK